MLFSVINAALKGIDAVICLVFGGLLFHHLLIKRYKWAYIQPNVRVICTSLFVSTLFTMLCLMISTVCVFCIVGDVNSNICNITNTTHTHYLVAVPETAIYHCGRFAYYLYLIFNLQNHMQHNEIIRRSIPRCFLTCMHMLILFLFAEAMLAVFLKYLTKDGTSYHGVPYRVIHEMIYIVGNLVLDISILYAYSRGLHKYATYLNSFEFEDEDEAERAHELLKIVTRFTVTFGASMFCDCMSVAIHAVFFGYVEKHTSEQWVFAWSVLILIGNAINDVSFVIAVYFSHEFGHELYEKCCYFADTKVERCCNTINRKQKFDYTKMRSGAVVASNEETIVELHTQNATEQN
eukprot:CAMPEP_0197036048 /NCGR_PEP_ID=MMETSP1384-20130603/13665_1 /TAXON_ID=29189 /ORGANISM="Ammonia sp." /LENGTH=348 /DNA_ID=CAMNT_0042466175 /DNA_START=47 /DNA_END=1093 /DNA_ORIENTATION=+